MIRARMTAINGRPMDIWNSYPSLMRNLQSGTPAS